jgi:hypothetical protein
MAAITYTFAPLSDVVLYDVEMPNTYKVIHTYCMKRLNITDWRLQPSDIAKNIGRSVKTVRRALCWFRDHGYGAKANDGRWIIYPSPQTPINHTPEPTEAWTKMSILEPVLMDKNVHLIEKKAFKEKETTTHEPIKQHDTIAPVVVSFEEEKQPETIKQPDSITPVIVLELPEKLAEKLNSDERKACKSKIKAAPIHLQEDVLFELLFRMTRKKITNPVGYLIALIKEANGDTPIFNYKNDKAFMASINKATEVIKKPPKVPPKPRNLEVGRGFMPGLKAALRGQL